MGNTVLNLSAVVGVPFSYIPISSTAAAWWAIYVGGLPPGITLAGAGSSSTVGGVTQYSRIELSGTPTAAGSYSVHLTCSADTSFDLNFTVSAPNPLDPPVISCADAVVEAGVNVVTVEAGVVAIFLEATNNGGNWTGSLPAGLTLNAGVVSGTISKGEYYVAVQASNYAWFLSSANHGPEQTATFAFKLVVILAMPVISIASGYSADFGGNYTVGDDLPNAAVFAVQDTALPVTWSAVGLPDGVSINPTTGFLTGKLAEAGEYNATVTATNSTGAGNFPLTLVVAEEQNIPVVSLASDQPGWAGQDSKLPRTLTFAVGKPVAIFLDGTHNPTAWAASDLPSGLTIDTATGTVSGALRAPGSFRFYVTATNIVGSSAAFGVTVLATGNALSFDFVTADPTLCGVQIDIRTGAVAFGRETPFKVNEQARLALIFLDNGSPVTPPTAANVVLGIRVNGGYDADYVLPEVKAPALVAGDETRPDYLLAEFMVSGEDLRKELAQAISSGQLPLILMADVLWAADEIPKSSQTFTFGVMPSVIYSSGRV